MNAPKPIATPDVEDNWFSLIEALKLGAVIPVIGPDLLEIEVSDAAGEVRKEKLEVLIAAELSRHYGLPFSAQPEQAWVLHDCVASLIAGQQINPDKIRRSVAKALATVTADCTIPAALQQLAAIENFRIFVSLSCDDLLFRALRAVDARAESVAYGIRSASDGPSVDIPTRPAGKLAYQLLGSASARTSLDFAIHEGDVLEYLFRLQSEQARRVRIILGAIRSSNLILIGCRLPDWAARSLLRLANNDSLQSKSTQEFIAEPTGDPALTTFISRFSPNSLIFPGSAADFVAELYRRWQETSRAGKQMPQPAPPPSAAVDGPLVFVSYASENSDAARTIADRLLELGAGDVWLDKKKLRGGDDWSQRIDQAIASCDYFLPLLSSEADQRREGVFWQEWGNALKRGSQVADDFILPTLIDADPDSRAGYQRIGQKLGTERFFKLHLLKAPAGELDTSAEDDLASRFADFRRS